MIKKSELYNQISALAEENVKLREALESSQREEWEKKIPNACEYATRKLEGIFHNLLFNLRFEHVDASGYWFSFELVNNNRRQSYAVRHEEVK